MNNPLIKVPKKETIKQLGDSVLTALSKHDAVLCTTGTIAFNVAGIAMTYKNAPEIHRIIEETKRVLEVTEDDEERKSIIKCAIKDLVPLVTPIIIFFASSTACAVIGHKRQQAKIASLTAALSLAHSTINEYDAFKRKVESEVGSEKYREIKNEVTKERIEEDVKSGNAPMRTIINGDPAIQLIYIPFFGIYYYGKFSRIETAMDRINTCLRFKGGSNGEYCYRSFNEFGNAVVTFEDLLDELGANVETENVPIAAKRCGWDSDKTFNVSYWIGDGHTSDGAPYLTLEFSTDSEPYDLQ